MAVFIDGICIIYVLFLTRCWGTRVDLTVQIYPGKLDCFWQYVPARTYLELEYQVLRGGRLDINILIGGPNKEVYLDEQQKHSEKVGFKSISQGDYKICFDNTFSRISSKLVFFEIYIHDGKDERSKDKNITFEEEGLKELLDMTVEELLGILERSKKNLELSTQIQTIIKLQEIVHRSLQEANFFWINYFAFVQLAAMTLASLIQVWLIRSLFLEKHMTTGSSLRAKT